MIKDQINNDLKTALLGGDKLLAQTLRGLKSAILYAEVAANKRDQGLSDDETVQILAKEAKKRQESADLYTRGGAADRAAAELDEKAAIEKYLPAQLSDDELAAIVKKTIAELDAHGPQQMGLVIGAVKQATAGQADGAVIARLVKQQLTE
jgi:uncharacterized protein YqeY